MVLRDFWHFGDLDAGAFIATVKIERLDGRSQAELGRLQRESQDSGSEKNVFHHANM